MNAGTWAREAAKKKTITYTSIIIDEEEEDENNNITTANRNNTGGGNEAQTAAAPPTPESPGPAEQQPEPETTTTRPSNQQQTSDRDQPFQPLMKFPGRKCGKENFERSFQYRWFSQWKWLHYVKEKDCVLCFACHQAFTKRLLHHGETSDSSTFSHGGFDNWKRARERFQQHESSELHSDSIRALALLKQTPINALLSDRKAKDQQTARSVLELIFRSIKYLGRQGMPLRGHEHRDGALWQLMLERTYNVPDQREWLSRRDNWMSDTIQNEVLEMFAHAIQRDIASAAQKCNFLGLTADGTTDISTCEQFSCCLQFVDSSLTAHNMFLGFYSAPDSTAETLFSCIKDIFLRFNLPLDKLQGYCFDGAANMSGRFNGVQAKLKAECPGSLYVHCSNHALDLALQEVSRDVRIVADTLNFVQGVAVVIKESSKRKALFQSLFGTEDVVNVQSLCPTRWCIRANAISRVISAYSVLMETLKTLEQDMAMRGDTRAKVAGLHKQAKKASTYFGLVCSEALFQPCESVAKSLQSPKITAGAALECIKLLQKNLQRLKLDAALGELMTKVTTYVNLKNLEMPKPTRTSKTPARFRHTTAPESVVDTGDGTGSWRRQFYEALNLIENEVGLLLFIIIFYL